MRNKIKVNKTVLQKMRSIYYGKDTEYIDWMGFRITDINKPSYHHIEKAESLRKKSLSDAATVENGAYLGKKSHELLHHVEHMDPELYESWNYLFSVINKMGTYPIEDVWDMVNDMKKKTLKLVYKIDEKSLKM